MNVEAIQKLIRDSASPCGRTEAEWVQRCLGTTRKYICLKSADRDRILRQVVADLKGQNIYDTIKTLDDLFNSDIFEDFNFAGKLLTRLPKVRLGLKMDKLEKWIKRSTGWAECDGLCQSLFEENEALGKWDEFENAIKSFRKSENIQLRRASLVLQVKPNRNCADPKMRRLAFETIEILKGEKEILITKAVSWLLREMSKLSKDKVKKYLIDNREILPAIAYREAMRKIETGKK
jgi:3-methyladenine DNA glycosylase AlkD